MFASIAAYEKSLARAKKHYSKSNGNGNNNLFHDTNGLD